MVDPQQITNLGKFQKRQAKKIIFSGRFYTSKKLYTFHEEIEHLSDQNLPNGRSILFHSRSISAPPPLKGAPGARASLPPPPHLATPLHIFKANNIP